VGGGSSATGGPRRGASGPPRDGYGRPPCRRPGAAPGGSTSSTSTAAAARARGPNGEGVRTNLYPAGNLRPAQKRFGTLSFTYEGDALRNWPNLADVELDLALNYTWLNHLLPLAAVDEATKTATLASPAVYEVRGFRVENVLDVLDEPGEWCLDTQEGRVYHWPPGGSMAGAEADAPTMVSVVQFLGDEAAGEFVQHITFRGFTVKHADRTRELRSLRPQFCGDSLDGAVLLRGAEHCTVEGCRIIETGAWGVLLDLHAQHNRIVGNTVWGAGAGGVLALGFGPGTRDVNHHNEISWNEIAHCGRIYYHSHGVAVWQSGDNRIEHNLIHDMPYCGICLLGVGSEYFQLFAREPKSPFNVKGWPYWYRWEEIDLNDPLTPESVVRYRHGRNNLVQYNVCHDLMKVVQDGGAYYNCSSGTDNVVRRNLAKDILSWGGNLAVYQDYESHAKTLEQDILVDGGAQAEGFWAGARGRTVDGEYALGGVELRNDERGLLETMMGLADTFQFAGAMDRPRGSLARRLVEPPRLRNTSVRSFTATFTGCAPGELPGQGDWDPFGPGPAVQVEAGLKSDGFDPGLAAAASGVDSWAAMWHGVILDPARDLVVQMDACLPSPVAAQSSFELYLNRAAVHENQAMGLALVGGEEEGVPDAVGVRRDSAGPRVLADERLTPGHWYRLRLVVPAGSQSGTLSARDLTAGERDFRTLTFADGAAAADLTVGETWTPDLPSLDTLVLRLGDGAQAANIKLENAPRK